MTTPTPDPAASAPEPAAAPAAADAIRVAGVQFDIAWRDPAENFRRVRPLAEQAVREGARLVVLPEMFATGFTMEAEQAAAAAAETRRFLASLAGELGVWVAGGLADLPRTERPRTERPRTERPRADGPLAANLALVFSPSGAPAACYQKIHPFTLSGEQRHYEGGKRLARFELPTAPDSAPDAAPLRASLFICYDLRFPELFRAAASGSDLMIVIANWPQARREHWRTLLRARAIENQCFVLGVNRVGQDGNGLPHSGDSLLVGPFGETLADGGSAGEEAIVAGEISAAEVARVRERYSFLADRRPEVYAALADAGE